jgi:hypothetical protein
VLDDKPEIRLGMMLGDYRIVLLPTWVGKRQGHRERHRTGYCFAQQQRLFSVDEAGQI